MNIKLIVVGKSESEHLRSWVEVYVKRLSHYTGFEIVTLPDVKNAKNLSVGELKEREGEMILRQIEKADKVVLLDEKGKESNDLFSSDDTASCSRTDISGIHNFERRTLPQRIRNYCCKSKKSYLCTCNEYHKQNKQSGKGCNDIRTSLCH